MELATCRMLAQRNAKAICIADLNNLQFEVVKKALGKTSDGYTTIDLLKIDVSSSGEVSD